MIFSTGLRKIYESIGSQEKSKQGKLLDTLHEKIAGSKALAHKFEILDLVQENAGMLTKAQAKKFFDKLNEKHSGFLKENNEVAMFYKEEKKLFEFFNINQKEVISEKLDLIVNKKDNELNESIILNYVTNKRFVSLQESMERAKPRLKEHFSQIKFMKDENMFEESINNLKFQATLLSEGNRKMVDAAIKSVYNESFSNFDSAVEKAYKLALLTEKYLREFGDDEADFDMDKAPKGRTVKLGNLNYLKDVSIEIPKDFDTDYVRFEFDLNIYHNEQTAFDIEVEFKQLLPYLNKLRRPFVKAIMENASELLDPNGVNLIADMRVSNIKPGVPYKAYFVVTAFVRDDANQKLFPVVDRGAQKGQRDLIAGYSQAALAVLKAFDAYLPSNEVIAKYLTPDNMNAAMANYAGRSKTYKKRAGTAYQQADNRRVSDDSWLDQAIFNGDTRAENDEEPIIDDYSDINSGQGIEPGAMKGVEDDAIDAEASAQARAKTQARTKPTLSKKIAA